MATPHGEVPIEDLKIGDRVLTASGESRPVLWLGHSDIDCTRLPDPSADWPIRIQAYWHLELDSHDIVIAELLFLAAAARWRVNR